MNYLDIDITDTVDLDREWEVPNWDYTADIPPIPDTVVYEPQWDEGSTCSICDGLGHGYPGAGPCPLEDRGYDTDGVWR
jgi:hypothetical protein